MRVIGWSLPLAVALACTPRPFSEADRSALAAGEQRLRASVLAADWAALSDLYADSAVLMPPGAPSLKGRNAILSRFGTSGLQINAFETTAREIDGVGSLAYVRGAYLLTAAPFGSQEPATQTGKYVRIWRREQGTWHIVADIWNVDGPPGGAAPLRAGKSGVQDTTPGAAAPDDSASHAEQHQDEQPDP